MAGMVGQTGVEDALDCRMAVEVLGDRAGVLAVRAACGARASSGRAGRASVSNGPGTAPSEFCRKARRSAIVGSFVQANAADEVGVAAEVLGRRVDDDVGAELERALQVRRREGVVDDDRQRRLPSRPRRPRGCRRCSGAGLSASRSRRAECARRLAAGESRRAGRSRSRSPSARTPSRRGVGAAVDSLTATTRSPGRDEMHDRRRRAHAGREREPVLRALQRRQADLERAARRVAARE